MEDKIDRVLFSSVSELEDVSNIFPIDNDASMDRFLSQNDGFEKRKRGFENMLFNLTSDQPSDKRQFGEAMKNLLFTRNYIHTHRWPHAWYVYNKKFNYVNV